MSDLRELYQEIILDHYRRPRNFGALAEPTHAAKGHNPLCGDRVAVTLELDGDGAIRDIRFDGAGCAISTASASLMTEAVKGQPATAALQIFARFHELVTGAPAAPSPADGAEAIDLGSLEALAGVRQLPVRVKCATLPWQALKAALLSEPRNVSTE
jgi:nitrogen fixation NifU-like protein